MFLHVKACSLAGRTCHDDGICTVFNLKFYEFLHLAIMDVSIGFHRSDNGNSGTLE